MEITYGSDKNGLICGYLFSNGVAGEPIGLTEALDWLRREPGPDGAGFVWLHFNLSDAAAETWIAKHLGAVVPEFFEALHEGSRSTRIEDAHDTLVAVVNDVA